MNKPATPPEVQRYTIPEVDEFMDAPHHAHEIALDVIANLEAELRAANQRADEAFNAGVEAAAMHNCTRCQSEVPLVMLYGYPTHEYHKGSDYRDCYAVGIRRLKRPTPATGGTE